MDIISFPEREWSAVKARLRDGKDLYSIRVSEEAGKYREADILTTEWGDKVSIVSVKSVSGGVESLKREYPFFGELDADMLAEIRPYDRMDILLMRKA